MKAIRELEVARLKDVTRVVVHDNHPVVRSGLRSILTAAGLVIVGEAHGLLEAAAVVAATGPDVIVAGIEATDVRPVRRLRAASGRARILLLSTRGQQEVPDDVLEAGASGYLLSDASEQEIVDAVRTVALGGTYIDARVAPALVQVPQDRSTPKASGERLSPREQEILRLLALGHKNSEIANELSISVRTVESHRLHIQQKLGRPSRAEMFSIARMCGLLDDAVARADTSGLWAEVTRLDADGVPA